MCAYQHIEHQLIERVFNIINQLILRWGNEFIAPDSYIIKMDFSR